MFLPKAVIKKIFSISDDFDITPEEMAKHLNVTFFPAQTEVSENVRNFTEKLQESFILLGVNSISYEESLTALSFQQKLKRKLLLFLENIKIFFYKVIRLDFIIQEDFLRTKWGRKVKAGIGIISIGEGETNNLPVDNKMSLRSNPVICIIDNPFMQRFAVSYLDKMQTGLRLFTWHVCNIIITVDREKWTIYSHNGSCRSYSLQSDFSYNILHGLIPKIAAPVTPPTLNQFIVQKQQFDVNDNTIQPFIRDLVNAGDVLEKTFLFPKPEKVDELPFRNRFYKWIATLHLDHRKGMSYGFIARQLPVQLTMPLLWQDAKKKFDLDDKILTDRQVTIGSDQYIIVDIEIRDNIPLLLLVKIPEVWVLTSKSGADKTKLDASKDVIKMGLKQGQMILQIPNDLPSLKNYRPSFDTRVILAHAVGNAIQGNISLFFDKNKILTQHLQKSGLGLIHWHGYVAPSLIPSGWSYFGQKNPSVSCSSPQSVYYAIQGKLSTIKRSILNDVEFKGDIHIEPDHGTNMTFFSVRDGANFLSHGSEISQLGDEYFDLYF